MVDKHVLCTYRHSNIVLICLDIFVKYVYRANYVFTHSANVEKRKC